MMLTRQLFWLVVDRGIPKSQEHDPPTATELLGQHHHVGCRSCSPNARDREKLQQPLQERHLFAVAVGYFGFGTPLQVGRVDISGRLQVRISQPAK